MAIRTFLAVDIDEATRQQLGRVDAGLPTGRAKLKWVRPGQRHVTVKFFGDVPAVRIPDVCRLARAVAAGVQPLVMEVVGLIAIPQAGRRLRMIWAGVTDPSGRLGRLADACQSRFAEMGFPPENRGFRPHITLARIRSCPDAATIRQAIVDWSETEFGTVAVSSLTVYASHLGRGGPRYDVLARATLGGGA